MDLNYQKKIADLGIPLVVAPSFSIKADHIKVFNFKRAYSLINRAYLTSSMAFMMADAIAEGYPAIHLYGITLTAESEYYSQRPCMEFWRGFAEGRGIEVKTPANCPLGVSNKIYGKVYEEGPFSEESILELAEQHRAKLQEIQNQRAILDTMETAQLANAQLLENLAIVAKRYGENEVIKRLTDVVRVK